MKQSALTKNQYQQMIRTYERRREKLRQRYGRVEHSPIARPEYAQAVFQINQKLRTWRRAIARLDKRQVILHSIGIQLESFLDCKVRHSAKEAFHKNKDVILARKIFCKYAIEKGFSSPDVMAYLSRGEMLKSGRYQATEIRRKFTRSFKTNQYHHNTWHRFMQFMRTQINQPKNPDNEARKISNQRQCQARGVPHTGGPAIGANSGPPSLPAVCGNAALVSSYA